MRKSTHGKTSARFITVLSGIVFILAGAACGPASTWPVFRGAGYAISYPPSWRVDRDHDYQALGPGKDIRGTAFVVSPSLAFGTNLSNDSYLAVETLPGAAHCTADLFLDDADASAPSTQTEGGITYSVQHGSDAGAGNFYDETVYAVSGAQPCLAVRYFIHSTNIGNYPPGSVTQFDQTKLQALFGRMRASFRITR